MQIVFTIEFDVFQMQTNAIRDRADSWQGGLGASRGGGRDRVERSRGNRGQKLKVLQVVCSCDLVPRHVVGRSRRPRLVLSTRSAQTAETTGALSAHCAGKALHASRWANPFLPPWVHFLGISPPAFLHPHPICDRSLASSPDGRAALPAGSILRGTPRHRIITGSGLHSAGPSGNEIRDFFSSVGTVKRVIIRPSRTV